MCPPWLWCCVGLAGLVFLLSPVLSPSLSPIWSGICVRLAGLVFLFSPVLSPSFKSSEQAALYWTDSQIEFRHFSWFIFFVGPIYWTNCRQKLQQVWQCQTLRREGNANLRDCHICGWQGSTHLLRSLLTPWLLLSLRKAPPRDYATRRHNRQQPGWDRWPGPLPCCQPSVPAGVLLQMLLGFLIKTCLAELWNCITEGQLNLMLCFIFCKYWGELWAMYIVYDYKDQINAMSFSAYGNLTSVWKNRGGSIDNLKRSCTRTAKKRVNRASTRSRITSTDEIKNQRAISAMMCNCKGIYLRFQSELCWLAPQEGQSSCSKGTCTAQDNIHFQNEFYSPETVDLHGQDGLNEIHQKAQASSSSCGPWTYEVKSFKELTRLTVRNVRPMPFGSGLSRLRRSEGVSCMWTAQV